jgi:hypothetical protein
MSNVTEKIKEELLAIVPPTLYFFVILHIVAMAMVRALMLKGTGVTVDMTTSVTIAALVLGKSVLIADMMPLINRFPEKPLIWKRGVEGRRLFPRSVGHSLSRASVRLLEAGAGTRRCKREAAGLDRLASFLGDTAAVGGADSRLLRDERTRPCAGRSQGQDDVLRSPGVVAAVALTQAQAQLSGCGPCLRPVVDRLQGRSHQQPAVQSRQAQTHRCDAEPIAVRRAAIRRWLGLRTAKESRS